MLSRMFVLTLVMALLPVVLPDGLQAGVGETNPADLIGVWSAKRDFTPEEKGPIWIYRDKEGLSVVFAGHSLTALMERGEIRFELPGDRGYFRGHFANGNQQIRGHWVQPWTQSSFARFASPVVLSRHNKNSWVGQVTPMTDKLHFYLVIEQQEDGRISAFMRNPEANIGRFYTIGNIDWDPTGIKFRNAKGEVRLEGRYYPDNRQLSIYFPYNGGTYDFRRAADESTPHLYPRPKTDRRYRYSPPPRGEGWQTAHLADVNMNTMPIEELIRLIIKTPMDAIDAPYVHAILIARHGKLVLEEYFHGYNGEQPHATRSAGKSVTTTLVGMAIHQGLLTLDTPVYQSLYGGQVPAGLDDRAVRMTLEHLITMTPGWACDDADSNSPGNEDVMQNQEEQPDWRQYTLDLPMAHEPGSHAAYCSASQNMAGGVLAKVTDQWLPDIFIQHFADPLQIGLYHMNLTPAGRGYGGGGLFIKPRDFLKLGQLYLDNGNWNGRQLLSPAWVKAASTVQNKIWEESYGYGWWVFSYPYRGGKVKAFYAGGNGGQYVIVIPELRLNIAGFGGNYNQKVMHKVKYEYVRDYILPAIK